MNDDNSIGFAMTNALRLQFNDDIIRWWRLLIFLWNKLDSTWTHYGMNSCPHRLIILFVNTYHVCMHPCLQLYSVFLVWKVYIDENNLCVNQNLLQLLISLFFIISIHFVYWIFPCSVFVTFMDCSWLKDLFVHFSSCETSWLRSTNEWSGR